ncbi:MAG TPA: hypothetical protein VEA69_16740 [Tepidisphaeraceae bacterium]|nr:hypothetical protein [Tepidisphaeraceae bacterium]
MGTHLKTSTPATVRPKHPSRVGRAHISFPKSLRESAAARMVALNFDDFSEYVRHLIREDVKAAKAAKGT